MKKTLLLAGCLLAFGSSSIWAQTATQPMTLRGAIYLYDHPITTGAGKKLVGRNCDVFEIVLDVESGFTDLTIAEGSDSFDYVDRIHADAAMFAYTLYSQERIKSFTLAGRQSGALQQVGSATFFGYCFSTKEDGQVALYDEINHSCLLSDGTTVPNCQVD
ncbi:MAG: hypothetical protein LBB76_01505 [Azoarcus sp.]|jgi:hypothetical protein|nr:hypothetical protein [Azoarcus sp.]